MKERQFGRVRLGGQHQPLRALTEIELQVLQAYADGAENQSEVSKTLLISKNGVLSALNRIKDKLLVQTTTQAVAIAVRDGLVEVHNL